MPKVFDGGAQLWRKVVVDGVSVRWVDLGTRLVLRHVVRIVEAEGDSSNNSKSTNREGDNNQDDHENNDDTGEGEDGGRAATAEVDLSEMRWAECTEEERRRQSESHTKKAAGACGISETLSVCSFFIRPLGKDEQPYYFAIRDEVRENLA